eukprot:5075779-Prymnesium_polylepis.1
MEPDSRAKATPPWCACSSSSRNGSTMTESPVSLCSSCSAAEAPPEEVRFGPCRLRRKTASDLRLTMSAPRDIRVCSGGLRISSEEEHRVVTWILDGFRRGRPNRVESDSSSPSGPFLNLNQSLKISTESDVPTARCAASAVKESE